MCLLVDLNDNLLSAKNYKYTRFLGYILTLFGAINFLLTSLCLLSFATFCGFYRSSSQVVRGILRIKVRDITTGDGLIYQDVYYL